MTLHDEIAQEIALRLIEDRWLIDQNSAQAGAPVATAKEVDANAYPPRNVRSWCIPIPTPRAAWTGKIADLEKAVDSLWLERDSQPWINGSLAVYVWHGYHARTHTIYYAIHPAPYPKRQPASAPARTP